MCGIVFEIGRHLCEFMGLDLEMSITDHYNEVISVLHNTFKVQCFVGIDVAWNIVVVFEMVAVVVSG